MNFKSGNTKVKNHIQNTDKDTDQLMSLQEAMMLVLIKETT